MTTNVSISRSTRLVRCPACKKPQKTHASHCYACGSRLEPAGGSSLRASRPASSGGRAVPSRAGSQGGRSRVSRPSGPSYASRGSAVTRGSTRPGSSRGLSGPARSVTQNVNRRPASAQGQFARFALSTVDWAAIPTLPNPTIERVPGNKKPASATVRSRRYTSLTYGVTNSASSKIELPDIPTQPERSARTTRRLDPIEEVDTLPPVEIEEEPTLVLPRRQMVPAAPVRVPHPVRPQEERMPEVIKPATQVDEYVPPIQPFHTLSDGPFGNLRWWLLRPGRLEFILWVSGTILLVFLTCFLILDSIFSLVTITPAGHLNLNISSLPATSSTQTTPMTTLELMNKGSLSSDTSLQIEGKGFSPHSKVVFFFDEAHAFLAANGAQEGTESDASGYFVITLLPDKSPGWTVGKHLLIAREVHSHRSAVLGPLNVGSK